MRKILLFSALLSAGLAAQAAAPAGEPLERSQDRPSQKIERIHHEDAGSTIDELRVGGQTQSITVQPAKGPAYEMQPSDGARARPGEDRQGDMGKSQRVWNLFHF